ncbi:MAG: transposase [Actinomycetota bacterium]
MDARMQRGLQIVESGSRITEGVQAWFVRSQTPQNFRRYRVNPFADTCSCPDHQELNIRCKHLWAVLITMEQETPHGPVEQTTRITYSQEWSSYNAAAVSEKDDFMRLLGDLCRGVEEPEQKRGRPRLPLSDMAFATAYKVFSRFSSRRFSTDLRGAEESGLISKAPHFNSVSNYMSSERLTPVLKDLISTASLPLRAVESDFAVDSSGFSTSRFARWFERKHGAERVEVTRREWIKAHLMVGVQSNIVTAAEVSKWQDADSAHFPDLLTATAGNFEMREVSADKAYLGKRNVALVEQAGATPFIPFRSNIRPVSNPTDSAWDRMYHQFALNRDEWLAHYHKRSNVETTFAMIKAKFGDAVLSKSEVGMMNEVLAKVLCHNIVVVGQAIREFGIDPGFCAGPAAAQNLTA